MSCYVAKLLIKLIVGRKVSDVHRRMFALPVRLGGLGIVNPMEAAKREYDTSVRITEDLVTLIYNQEKSLKHLDKVKIKTTKDALKVAKEKQLKGELEEIEKAVDETTRESLHLIQEQGSGAWLTCLPVQRLGYAYTKVDFRDSVYLRYGLWLGHSQHPTVL